MSRVGVLFGLALLPPAAAAASDHQAGGASEDGFAAEEVEAFLAVDGRLLLAVDLEAVVDGGTLAPPAEPVLLLAPPNPPNPPEAALLALLFFFPGLDFLLFEALLLPAVLAEEEEVELLPILKLTEGRSASPVAAAVAVAGKTAAAGNPANAETPEVVAAAEVELIVGAAKARETRSNVSAGVSIGCCCCSLLALFLLLTPPLPTLLMLTW